MKNERKKDEVLVSAYEKMKKFWALVEESKCQDTKSAGKNAQPEEDLMRAMKKAFEEIGFTPEELKALRGLASKYFS